MWDVVEGACTASLEGPAVRWAACLDDGRHLLCASGDRTTTLWDLSTSTSSVAIPGSRGSRVKSWAASQVSPKPPAPSRLGVHVPAPGGTWSIRLAPGPSRCWDMDAEAAGKAWMDDVAVAP